MSYPKYFHSIQASTSWAMTTPKLAVGFDKSLMSVAEQQQGCKAEQADWSKAQGGSSFLGL